MYAIVAGGGKVGANVARSLVRAGHEVTVIEQRRSRFAQLENEFGHLVMLGDATEIHVLQRAGIGRPPDVLVAATGDDEDNLVICQIGREGYRVPKVIARVNDPRNQEHFDLLGITQTVCATTSLLGLVEHAMPEHGTVRLLDLHRNDLEVIEVQLDKGARAVGQRLGGLSVPDEARIVAVLRADRSELADAGTVLRPGDQVLAVVRPGTEEKLRRSLIR